MQGNGPAVVNDGIFELALCVAVVTCQTQSQHQRAWITSTGRTCYATIYTPPQYLSYGASQWPVRTVAVASTRETIGLAHGHIAAGTARSSAFELVLAIPPTLPSTTDAFFFPTHQAGAEWGRQCGWGCPSPPLFRLRSQLSPNAAVAFSGRLAAVERGAVDGPHAGAPRWCSVHRCQGPRCSRSL